MTVSPFSRKTFSPSMTDRREYAFIFPLLRTVILSSACETEIPNPEITSERVIPFLYSMDFESCSVNTDTLLEYSMGKSTYEFSVIKGSSPLVPLKIQSTETLDSLPSGYLINA